MRYKPGHREESRLLMLNGIGRGFRKRGYEGIGVDGLAKEAGVTSGAFYGHFASKEAAFKESMQRGLAELRRGIESFQAECGEDWLEAFVDFYLGEKRTCDLAEACAFQTLTPEVVRSGDDTRQAFQTELGGIVDLVANRLPGGTLAERRGRAWALLSLLAGAVTTTRALVDSALAGKAAKAIRRYAITIAKGD